MQNSPAQHGENLSFFLSQGLFSSGDVDTGTKLLLRTLFSQSGSDEIVQRFRHAAAAWDMGCGAGVIGIAVKKLFPHLTVHASDRDALACTITRINSERNRTPLNIASGLDMLEYNAETQSLAEPAGPVDIILTNIPAKAGGPVLERMCLQALDHLSSGGLFGIVIVQTLADMAETVLDELDAVLLRREDHRDHRILLYEKAAGETQTAAAYIAEAKTDEAKSDEEKTDTSDFHGSGSPSAVTDYPAAYERSTADFYPKSSSIAPYSLHTVFNIPGFDTLPHTARLTAKYGNRLFTVPPKRAVCIWGTGQGHTAVIISQLIRKVATAPSALPQIVLCDRDLLALLVSRNNLSRYYPRDHISLTHAEDLITAYRSAEEHLQLQFDGLLADHSPVPMVRYEQDVQFIADKLRQGTSADEPVWFAAAGKSADLAFLAKGLSHMRRILTKKYQGYRMDAFSAS